MSYGNLMMTARYFLTTLFLTTLFLAKGQTNYFSIKTIKNGKEFSFPIFLQSFDINSTDRINQLLQISELEILKGFERKNIFENVSKDNGTIYGGKVEISFEIKSNTPRLLSLQLNESSCGATCAYWVKYYNFNSGNGEMLQLRDLFTEIGYKIFYKIISKKRISEFKKQLTKLDTSEKDGFLDITGCYEDNNLEDFYIKGNTLYIDGENCFSKNQKSSDIETISKFNLSEFKKYLNDYGKTIFSLNQKTVEKFHSSTLPQLFQGKISEQDVLMVLNNGYKQEMRAEYVYLKYGKGIFLEGELNKNELTLKEKNSDFGDNGFIEAKYDGQQIIGAWTNKNKTKKYKINLTRK